MSVLGRFDDELKNRIDEIRENGGESQEFLNYYMSERPVEKWRASDLNIVPAKIYGLKRSYSLEVYESGNMLVAEEALEEEEYINGVVIFPLDEEQMKKISETEKSYRKLEKSREDIESYISGEKLDEEGLEIPEKVSVYVAKDSAEEVNKDTKRTRNEAYHQYIVNGIDILAEEWCNDKEKKEELVENFMEDFRKTTLEIDENREWKRMSEK